MKKIFSLFAVALMSASMFADPNIVTPTISGETEFTDSVIVTMSCPSPNADIYYTTDGTTDPKCDCDAAPEYKKPIIIRETTVIKAAAYDGNDWSGVAEVTFTKAGMHKAVLYAVFTQGTDSVPYTEEYWETATPITVSISESRLDMPNAFSPNNGDDINNIYRAKPDYQSIVEFHAYIFNRWGQKLYEWHDPAGGWDGKYKGKDVAQGVYYCLVKAKGADGRVYNFHTDVNLLRGFTEDTGVNNMNQ